MIFMLIFFLAIVVFTALFIGKNLQPIPALWFFKTFENVPTSVLVLSAFAAGIVFCILVMLFFKLKKSFFGSNSSENLSEKTTEEKSAKRENAEKKFKKIRGKFKNKGGLLNKAEEISNSIPKENENSVNRGEKA